LACILLILLFGMKGSESDFPTYPSDVDQISSQQHQTTEQEQEQEIDI
tara:strand:- start:705 stop:848 length:144 start_codon:yes stop_codon:yes gene_type:complete